MARMIPAVDPSELEHASEEVVYVALQRQLSDEFIVLHSYPWLRPWRDDGALLEGEADFVVLHPHHGLLVLEVKGGETIRHDGHRWFRDTRDGPQQFQDPFLQARRNMHALLDIAKERSGGRVQKHDLVHGYAVVFPHMDYQGPPPPHADKAIVISRRHLAFIDQAIMTAYRAWTAETRPLRPNQFHTLLNDCLMPRFGVFRPIGRDISIAADHLLQLTEAQAQVFEGLYAQDRVLVEGVAGSGKTILALQRALAFAREGKRTLFVCYNKILAGWIRRQVEEDPTLAEYRQLLTVDNFHALAAQFAEDADIAFRPADGGELTQQFWDEEVPDLLEQAILALELAGNRVQFDAIVVDEAQDFALGWWYALTHSLLNVPDGPVYAFLDPNQSLRGKVEWPPIKFDTRFRLTINCRNTRKIAVASATVIDLDATVFPRAPAGIRPRLLRAPSQRQQKGLVLQELRKLLDQEDLEPQQIAVLGPAAKANGSLADVEEVNGVPLVTSADEWRDARGILVTTTRAFKGLEADAVLLYDLGDFGRLFRKEDLYVACTRAKVLLVAIVHGSECRAAIDAAIDASETQT
jgi:hypothetical protein